MMRSPVLIGIRMTASILAMTGMIPLALAAQSSSFQLHGSLLHESTHGAASEHFRMETSGLDWKQNKLTGNTFTLSPTPPAASSSSSPSSPSSPSAPGGTTGGSGLKPAPYPPGTPVPDPSSPPSSPAPSPEVPMDPDPADPGEPTEPVTPPTSPLPVVPEEEDGEYTVPPFDPLIPPLPEGTEPGMLRFFDAVDPLCPACACEPATCPTLHPASDSVTMNRMPYVPGIMMGLLLVIAGAIMRSAAHKKERAIRRTKSTPRTKRLRLLAKRKYRRIAAAGMWMIMIGALLGALSFMPSVQASGVPKTHIYNGHLLDNTGKAVSGAHTIRFSYWTSADFVPTDITAGGAIDTNAPHFAGWQEVHTVTPDANGYFSVQLGSLNPLLDFSSMNASVLSSIHLQVEVKAAAADNTEYELLDVDPSDSTKDRSPIVSVPFSLNADQVNQRSVGTGSGSIPLLGSGGVLAPSMIPGGTTAETFTIGTGDSGAESITLQFGETLAKTLTYDVVQGRFTFNADVRIEGNLHVTGLINGVDISTLESDGSALKASSGGGLNLNVSQGNYRINGAVTDHGGSNIALEDNATMSVFFGTGGIEAAVGGFPTDRSHIPVAEVTTVNGSIHSIQDKRVVANDDREESVLQTFHPVFEKASYQGDGTDNVGQLTVGHDNLSMHNFYLWTSTRPTLQDYDILVRVPLPRHFSRWTQGGGQHPLSIMYRSTSADAADNKLDIQVYDTNGVPVSLSGSTVNLASTSWQTTHIGFTGTPTWTAGQDFLVRLKVSARTNFQIHIGSMRLRYVEFKHE